MIFNKIPPFYFIFFFTHIYFDYFYIVVFSFQDIKIGKKFLLRHSVG